MSWIGYAVLATLGLWALHWITLPRPRKDDDEPD